MSAFRLKSVILMFAVVASCFVISACKCKPEPTPEPAQEVETVGMRIARLETRFEEANLLSQVLKQEIDTARAELNLIKAKTKAQEAATSASLAVAEAATSDTQAALTCDDDGCFSDGRSCWAKWLLVLFAGFVIIYPFMRGRKSCKDKTRLD